MNQETKRRRKSRRNSQGGTQWAENRKETPTSQKNDPSNENEKSPRTRVVCNRAETMPKEPKKNDQRRKKTFLHESKRDRKSDGHWVDSHETRVPIF